MRCVLYKNFVTDFYEKLKISCLPLLSLTIFFALIFALSCVFKPLISRFLIEIYQRTVLKMNSTELNINLKALKKVNIHKFSYLVRSLYLVSRLILIFAP